MSQVVAQKSAQYMKERPEVRPGFTVRVYERIQEGGKERLQAFEGLVISVHKGQFPTDTTITVRKIASGIGVEKVFSLHSPNIDRIEVKKVAKIRRAKLFFLRGRFGKSARLSERFTTANEFASVAPPAMEEEASETTEAPAEQPAETETPAETASAETPETQEEKPAEQPSEEPAEKQEETPAPAETEEPKEEEKKAE